MKKTATSSKTARKVSAQDLLDALNNPKKGDALIKEMGWKKSQLIAEGSRLIGKIAKSINDVNVV